MHGQLEKPLHLHKAVGGRVVGTFGASGAQLTAAPTGTSDAKFVCSKPAERCRYHSLCRRGEERSQSKPNIAQWDRSGNQRDVFS